MYKCSHPADSWNLSPHNMLFIFVQFTSIKDSGGQIEARLTSANGRQFIGRMHVMDRNDGSYVINFRPVTPQKDVDLTIKLDGKQLGKSPYRIEG